MISILDPPPKMSRHKCMHRPAGPVRSSTLFLYRKSTNKSMEGKNRGGKKGTVDKAAQPGIAIDPARTPPSSQV